MEVTLLGIGMGTEDSLTGEAKAALNKAQILLGAARVLRAIPQEISPAKRVSAYLPADVLAHLGEHSGLERAVVDFSGDTGFYSGARQLLPLLREAGYPVQVLPGISTVQALCARLGIPWQQVYLTSAHGVKADVLAPILNHRQVFYLTGGQITPGVLCEELCRAGLGDTRITVGSCLGSPQEEILSASAWELAGQQFPSLSAVLAQREKETFRCQRGCFGIPDEAFIRGPVPMTKAEVRAVILSKLALSPDSVAYDVGAGTGSVSVEMAFQARWGRVYGVEENPAALDLIAQNREAFGVYNLIPVAGRAPEALSSLPAPDAVFVGGSKGELEGILRVVLAKNPRCRVVISAVTVETLSCGMALLEQLGFGEIQCVQIGVSRAEKLGGSHLFRAQNPIFLLSGEGPGILE